MKRWMSAAAGLALALGASMLGAEDQKPAQPAGPGLLGLESRAAKDDEKSAFELGNALAGRVQGVIADDVTKQGPAALAGIVKGDAILAADNNELYSNDDLQDFVATAKAGQKIKFRVKHAATKKEETIDVTLGAAPLPKPPHLQWQFAGPAQLDAALALAKKDGKKVMVGVSGAET